MKKSKIEAFLIKPTTISDQKIIYSAVLTYEEISSLVELKDIIFNRDVAESRVKKMEDFIRKEKSFYPPLVLSTKMRGSMEYDSVRKSIMFNRRNNESIFYVIDGQHRYSSIKKIVESKEVSQAFKMRKQAVLIIDNIGNMDRREIFIDINDTVRKVSTISRERLKPELCSVISLKCINENSEYSKYINLDKDQSSRTKEFNIPYKLIMNSNKILMKNLDFFSEVGVEDVKVIREYYENHMEQIMKVLNVFWSNFFELLKNECEKYKFLLNVGFSEVFCEYQEPKISEFIRAKTDLKEVDKYIKKQISNLNLINIDDILKKHSKKPDKIENLKAYFDSITEEEKGEK